MKTDALLLDLDGTLADTAPDFGGALNRQLIRHGKLPLTFAELRHLVTDGSAALIRAGFERNGSESDFDDLRNELLDEYASAVCVQTALFPGFDELLTSLESRGIAWGVVTNKPSRFTNPLMQALELDKRASCIVSADEVPRAKPHPDSLLKGAQIAGVLPENCVYVGDSIRDIEAARAAGMRAVGAVWGYIASEDEPERWGADGLVTRASELEAWI